MNEYISLEALKIYKETEDYEDDDSFLLGLCYTASRMIDGTTRRFFYPKIDTRDYDHPEREADTVLKVDGDLLAVTTFTTNNGNTTVSASDYFLMTGTSYNLAPYDRIALKSDGTQPNLLYSGTIQKANQVIGTWGYHEDYDNAWLDSLDAVADVGGINASVTSITVTDADGADSNGVTPRFSAGQLLQIGSEWLYASAVDTTTNKLTVVRGVNGSTAAIHAQAVTIYVYRPEADIEHAARRLAAWLYAQKDTPYSSRLVTPQTGVIEIPAGAPVDVMARIAKFIDRSGR